MTVTAGFTSRGLDDIGSEVILDPGGFAARRLHWGHPWQIGTARYWVSLTAEELLNGRFAPSKEPHRLGSSLAEEIVACILGGYGMRYEMGLAAFQAVRDEGLLERSPTTEQLEAVLRRPLSIGNRRLRYRFPAQRAAFVADALEQIACKPTPNDPIALRTWLLKLRGVGPKTAAWVVRNHLSSDSVAIIDVHIQRAAIRAGVFDPAWTVARDYTRMEAFFLAWAGAGDVRASALDAVIWRSEAAAARRPTY